MTKEVNEVHWMDIKSVARELSTGDRIVSTSDVLQWCGNKTLKASCYLFNKLARPQHEYCPLLEDGYYQLIARKIIQVEESQLVSKISNPLSNTDKPVDNYDFRSSEFNNMVKERASEHDKKILIKAKEIFKRWKSRGGFRVRHSYGNNTMLDGVYSFYIDKELSNWMQRKALGYEVTPIKSLHVTDEEGAIFQIIDSNGEPETFELRREDLIVTKDALAAFEEKSGMTSKDKAKETGWQPVQDRREVWLKRLIDEKGTDALKPLGQLGVWNECAKLANDPHLLLIQEKRTSLIRGFYKKQSLIKFR